MNGETCRTCEKGTIVSRREFRSAGPVVAIGFILLILSLGGMTFAGFLGFADDSKNEAAVKKHKEQVAKFQAARVEAEDGLKKKAVPPAIIAKVMALQDVDPQELAPLKEEQQQAIRGAQINLKANAVVGGIHALGFGLGAIGRAVGRLVAVLLSMCLGFLSLIGLLAGCWLVMWKKVARCDHCGICPTGE